MQVKSKLFCNWDLARFVTEEHLKQDDGTIRTLSITDGEKLELMIFLGKDDDNLYYEVMVYKADPLNIYVPDKMDNVSRYEENEEYATFFFEEYEYANIFVRLLGYIHPEYKQRPTRKFKN